MSIQRRGFLGLVGAAVTGGCSSARGEGEARTDLTVATTTSTYDSGLLDALHPTFEARFDARMKTLSQGTGAALRTGRDGDCDVVFVHAPDAERSFVEAGYGTRRYPVMETEFLLVGPSEDPAGIGGLSITEALPRLTRREAQFVSRGDDSGTHQRERALWEGVGVAPTGRWYVETGRGMGHTLITADQAGGYTLVDRATFAATRDNVALEPVVEAADGDSSLLVNPYHVIPVSPDVHASVAYELARGYVEFLTGTEGQQRIAEFDLDGRRPFVPTARDIDR